MSPRVRSCLRADIARQRSARAFRHSRSIVRPRSIIDASTRRLVAAQRLIALELDNCTEEGPGATGKGRGAPKEDQDEYAEEEEVAQGGSKGRKRKRTAGSRGSAAAAAAGESASKAAHHPPARTRDLDRVITEEEYSLEEGAEANYANIASAPSTKPARHFCSVCGFASAYTCTRCGLRFCGLRCQRTHKETRCLKFAE
jgi:hypothetical protein